MVALGWIRYTEHVRGGGRMKTIRHHSTLFYYDGHQVFEARDAIGGHYIAVMAGSDSSAASERPTQEDDIRYLVAGVSPDRLRLFRSGSLDLRSLLVESDRHERFLAVAGADIDQPLQLERLSIPLESGELLPDHGFLLHDRPADDPVLHEARERNNLVIKIAADPPESASQHRIRANKLAGILSRIQTVVKYAYRSAIDTSSRHHDDDMLDVVVPAYPGSFQVVLEASNLPDLFGCSDLGRALKRVDQLFEDTTNAEATLAVVKRNRGHLAGSYLKLLRFLVESRTGLRYSWAEPRFDHPIARSVSETEAGCLVDVLSSVDKLAIESVILEGVFVRFNRNSGAWGLHTDEGLRTGKIMSGEPSLDGLEVGGRYRFFCDEEIEALDITGRESRALYLNRHEPA